MACFELCFSSVLMQNKHTWNFQLLSLNKWKLIWYSESLWYAIVSIMTHFDHNTLFVCIIGKSNVPGKYPAGEFPASWIFGWIFCWMAFGHLKKVLFHFQSLMQHPLYSTECSIVLHTNLEWVTVWCIMAIWTCHYSFGIQPIVALILCGLSYSATQRIIHFS